jgi:hypothetical protein
MIMLSKFIFVLDEFHGFNFVYFTKRLMLCQISLSVNLICKEVGSNSNLNKDKRSYSKNTQLGLYAPRGC